LSATLLEIIFHWLVAPNFLLSFADCAAVPSQNLFSKALSSPTQQVDQPAHELPPITALEL